MIDSASDPPKEGFDFVSEKQTGSRRQERAGKCATCSMASLALALLVAACAPGSPNTRHESDPATATEASEAPASRADAPASAADAEDEANDETARSEHAESSDTSDGSGDQQPDKEATKAEERKQKRRVLLRTAYDDRSVGEEQTAIVEAELGIYDDEQLERYVNSVAVRLLRHAPPQPFDYEFRIVDQVVPNAFAIPGGKIYVSRGLLALVGSEDELAAVLGHEITHAAERHSAARIEHARRINPFAIGILRAASIAAYGRENERDADRGGQILAASAGYDPNGIATFLRKLDAAERYEVGWSRLPFFLATHPTSPERSAIASQRASELSWEKTASVASQTGGGPEYTGMIDGLVLGDDPAGGLFKDGRFVHPDMRFSLRFPPGWTTQNSPQAVSAIAPSRDAEASLSAIGAAGDLDQSIDEFLAQEVDGVKFQVLDRRPIKVGELPGVRVVAKARGLHSVMSFIEYEGLVFRLTLLSTGGAERKYRGRANAFVQSFRPLDDAGVYSLEVMRLRIARALESETLQQLSVRTRNDLELVYTGVLNNLFASSELSKGQRVKIGLNEPYFPAPREEEEGGAKEGGEDAGKTSLEKAPTEPSTAGGNEAP
jgi:predicted Zn-dependent protease